MKIIKNKFLSLTLVFLFINLSLFNSCLADTTPNANSTEDNAGWQFLIAPYGWMSSLSVNATVNGVTTHIFLPFSKILQNLDFAGEVHIEASHGPWIFMLDPTYLRLSQNYTSRSITVGPLNRFVIGPITAHIVSQTTLIDGGIFYRLISSPVALNQVVSFELLGGGRYLNLNNDLTLNPNRSQLFPGINVSSTLGVAAPIVGARIKDDFNKVHLWLRGDVGGFGVDNVKNTWSSTAGISYTVYHNVELGLAYRVLKIDVSKTNSSFDALMYGPELGVGFQF